MQSHGKTNHTGEQAMTNPNDPTSPVTLTNTDGRIRTWPGLTKREDFAKIIAAGLAASGIPSFGSYGELSERAVLLTDALIDALNKGKK